MKKRKKILLLSILFAFVLLSLLVMVIGFNHFHNNEDGEIEINSKKVVNGFEVDNKSSLSNLLTKQYSLTELRDFFGAHHLNEAVVLEYDYKSLDWDEVNADFQIECLRNDNLSYYTVYKVQEGGYFYVFWSVPQNKNQIVSGQEFKQEVKVFFCAYLNRLRDAQEFKSIKERESTAEDVFSIDEATELDFLVSTGPCSYSPLKNDNILLVKYCHNEDSKHRSDLLVKSIEIVKKEEVSSHFSSILSKDLPN